MKYIIKIKEFSINFDSSGAGAGGGILKPTRKYVTAYAKYIQKDLQSFASIIIMKFICV